MSIECCKRIYVREMPLMVRNVEDLEASTTKEFRFQIENFKRMALEVDSFVDRQPVFNGTRYLVKIYYNGITIDESEGWVSLVIFRTGIHPPMHYIYLTFGIVDREGQIKHRTGKLLKRYDLALEPIRLLPTSEACNNENNFLHGDCIVIYCNMSLVEHLTRPENPFNAPGETIGNLVIQNVKEHNDFHLPHPVSAAQAAGSSEIPSFVRHEEQNEGLVSGETEGFYFQDVIWTLPRFTEEMTTTSGYNAVSPDFKFIGETYRMRIFTKGRCKYEGSEIFVMLERLRSSSRKHRITCELSVKRFIPTSDEEHSLEEFEDILGPIKVVPSVSMSKHTFMVSSLEVSCEMLAEVQ